MTVRDWPWRFEARVRRVVDADTLDLVCDCGFSVDVRVRVRVLGVDAPELRTPEGRAAELWAITLLGAAGPHVIVETRFDRSFDRYLATVTLADGRDYGELLVEAGHAVLRPR